MDSSSDWDFAVGVAIAAQRCKLRKTQEVLAGAAGVHRNYLADVERGKKSPTMRVLFQLALALETTPDRIAKTALKLHTDPAEMSAMLARLPPRRPGRPSATN
jgi:transcriptional regulator with XRE-family HTH domain